MTTHKSVKKQYWHLFSLAVLFAYIFFIEYFYSWKSIAAAWSEISFIKILSALILMFMTYVIRAIRLYNYVSWPYYKTIFACLKVTLWHNFFNNLMPMRSGEASFPLLMRKELSIPIASSTATLIIFRLMDFQVLLSILCVVFFMSGHEPFITSLILLILLIAPLSIFPFKYWIKNNLHNKYLHKHSKQLTNIIESLPENFLSLLRAWFFTWCCWSTKIVIYAIIIGWFSKANYWQVLGAALSGELSSGIPIQLPAGLGTYEAGMIAVSKFMGIEGEWILFSAVQLHLMIIVSILLGGIVAYLMSFKAVLVDNTV